jgi:hypothetical protein
MFLFNSNETKLANSVKIISTVFVIASIAISLPISAISNIVSEFEPVTPDEVTVGTIKFKENTKIEDSFEDLKALKKEGVTVTGITSKFKNGDQEITDFLMGDVTGLGKDKIKKDLKEKRSQFVKNQVNLAKDINKTFENDEKSTKAKEDYTPKYEIEKQEINISNVNIVGKKADLDKVKDKNKKKSNIESTEIKKLKKNKNSDLIKKIGKALSGTITASAQTWQYEPWSSQPSINKQPNAGTTYFANGALAGEDANSTRWNYNYVKWNQNNFEYHDTYEHEVYLWNGPASPSSDSYKTYLTRNNVNYTNNGFTYTECIPEVKYAASSLPSAYLDTRLDYNYNFTFLYCDSDSNQTNEISYTIGSSYARNIQPNNWYFTYISTGIGDRNKPVYKVQGQVGANNYAWPVGTWSSFKYKDGTTPFIKQSDDNFILNPYYDYNNNWYTKTFNRQ